MAKLTSNIFTAEFLQKYRNLKYLHAVTLIIETEEPILDKTYWLNICVDKMPLMLLAQHTNLVDKKNYAGHHISYTGWYVKREDKLVTMDKDEILKLVIPHITKIAGRKIKVINCYKFVGPFAQPIFDKDFAKYRPEFITPVKNFFIANLDMTYPYDRGTNYAVKLGREVSEIAQ